MKKFICMKKQFRLFCVVFLMLGLLGIPMSVQAADTVLAHKLYHKHVAGCIGTLYKTMEAEVKDGPHITYDSTCSSCGGYVHHYDYSAECSCGLTWHDTGKACVNSPYGSNRGSCSNYEEVRLDTVHEHPYEEYVCGMTEDSVIETIRVQYSTLQPATEVVLTAVTGGNLGNIQLSWNGGNSDTLSATQNGVYKLYAAYSDGGVQYVTELETTVNNIDRTAPMVSEITADKTSPTNGKVVLSIEAKDSVGLPVNYASWNGGAYGNSNQCEVTTNGTYTVSVRDLAGNTVTKSINISNIDTTAPTVSEIRADKTGPTNGKVILSVETKDNMGLPTKYASWNGGAYGNSNQYEVTANGTYKVTVKDLAGNTVSKSIKITNIDKTAPDVSEITADKTSPTNGKVVLSIEAKDNMGLPTKYASWNGGAYGNSNQYEVTANGTYKVTVKDLAGNTVSKSIKITNIDKTAPVVSEITADKTSPTNGKVLLSIEAKDSVGLPAKYASWNGGAYGNSNQYEVTANGTYKVTVKDLAGNKTTKSIKISNIDLEVPVVSEIKADKTVLTNDKVILTVEATDNVGLPEKYASWNSQEYGMSNLCEVSENGIYHVKIRDIAGNTATKSIEINNIDKENPVVTEIAADKTEATNDKVILSIEVKDNMDLPENHISWNGGEPGNSNRYEVTENGTYQAVIKDAAGNTVTKTIEINNIDKTAPEIVSVITTPVPWYYDYCTITVDATDKGDSGEGSGLAKEAYSWDGGKTWTSENTYEVSEPGTIVISVRDNAGNIAQAEVDAVKEKPAKKENESENSETEQSHNDSSVVETTPTVSITADVAEQKETTENTSEEKSEEGSKDYILPEIEKEETVVEQESFLEENEMLELDTLENDKNNTNGIVILCILAGLLLGLSILFIAVYVLFGMCRVYEISPAGKEHYLGRVGIGYRKKNFIVRIGMRMIENASERILMIRIPGWFVKINENRPLRIIAGALVITKYVEKEIQFHIQV